MPHMDIVRETRRLIDTAVSRAVEFELAAGSAGPWHCHSHMLETCYCLGAALAVDVDGAGATQLKAGERCEIPAGIAHRIRNDSPVACRYLVVQQGGSYDFVERGHP